MMTMRKGQACDVRRTPPELPLSGRKRLTPTLEADVAADVRYRGRSYGRVRPQPVAYLFSRPDVRGAALL
jgi:hypothetical protein